MSTAYDGSTAVLPIEFPGVNLFPTKVVGANWVHTFSANLINSARIGFTRTDWNTGLPQDRPGSSEPWHAKVGITFPNQSYNGFSFQGINAASPRRHTAFDGGLIDNTYSYMDDVTWQRGLHTLSFGVEAIRYENNYPPATTTGIWDR